MKVCNQGVQDRSEKYGKDITCILIQLYSQCLAIDLGL